MRYLKFLPRIEPPSHKLPMLKSVHYKFLQHRLKLPHADFIAVLFTTILQGIHVGWAKPKDFFQSSTVFLSQNFKFACILYTNQQKCEELVLKTHQFIVKQYFIIFLAMSWTVHPEIANIRHSRLPTFVVSGQPQLSSSTPSPIPLPPCLGARVVWRGMNPRPNPTPPPTEGSRGHSALV
jgi:hypothetical protein